MICSEKNVFLGGIEPIFEPYTHIKPCLFLELSRVPNLQQIWPEPRIASIAAEDLTFRKKKKTTPTLRDVEAALAIGMTPT